MLCASSRYCGSAVSKGTFYFHRNWRMNIVLWCRWYSTCKYPVTISESSQVVWDCRRPVLQHGEVTTRTQKIRSSASLSVPSSTGHWSSMLRNVWHLAMNRVISSTFLRLRWCQEHHPRWCRGQQGIGSLRGNAGLDPESAGAIGASMRTEALISWESSPNLSWNNATRSWPSWFLPVFSCICAFWVENLSDNFWRTSICFLSDTANPQSSSTN